jgi:hypothetical protein
MRSILEELQTRVAEAEKRVNEAGSQLQAADKAYSAAVNEMNVWRSALEEETRRQQAAKQGQGVFVGMERLVAEAPNPKQLSIEASAVVDPSTTFLIQPDGTISIQSGGTNKTELIRAILRQNPAGLTPPQIWGLVSAHFKHRPYLYSVLKRLKDHDEVITRRNKYLLRQGTEASQSLTVQ